MKVVILAGGLGSRLAEYTKKIPKPMVKIAEKPSNLLHNEALFKFWIQRFYYSGGI